MSLTLFSGCCYCCVYGNPLQYSCLENPTDGGAWCRLLSMGFSKQEYWSGLPFASLEDLSDPGIKPVSPALQVVSLHSTHQISC